MHAQQDVFSDIFAYSEALFISSERGERHVLPGLYVSGHYFDTLGVPAALGRALSPWDDDTTATLTCVISYGLWERQYGKELEIIGQGLRLNGHQCQIVGVMPSYFFGVDVGERFDVIVPLSSERTLNSGQPATDSPNRWWLSVAGRLRPGIDVRQATARLHTLAPSIFNAALPPGADPKDWQRLLRLKLEARLIPTGMSGVRDRYRQALLLSIILVAVVLIVACLNIGTLSMARVVSRQQEFATRVALGATRFRLVRQLLTETTSLCLVGLTAGLVLARLGTKLLVAGISSPEDPHFLAVSIDTPVLTFIATISIIAVLLSGTIPALRIFQSDLYSATKSSTGGRMSAWLVYGRALVAVQVALSVFLLIAAGLFVRTLRSLSAQDIGFDPRGVLVIEPDTPTGESAREEITAANAILSGIRTLPGVTSAARWTSARTTAMRYQPNIIVDDPGGQTRSQFHGFFISISPDFFRTLATPLIAGRDFNYRDEVASPAVAIVSEVAARAFFGGRNPVGLHFSELDGTGSGGGQLIEVIGVAKDAKYGRPNEDPLPIIFRPVEQTPTIPGLGTFYIRFNGPTSEIVARIKGVVMPIDPRIGLDFHLLSTEVADLLQRERFTALVSTVFGALAFIIVAIGVYGIASYSSLQRTKEIGVRIAVGATRRNVIQMLVREGLEMVLVGLVVGVPTSYWVMLLVREMLYGVHSADPLTIVVCCGAMVVVSSAATFVAAFRVSKVDPLTALKSE
jgi:predicted permease